jgi:hypothetical protein
MFRLAALLIAASGIQGLAACGDGDDDDDDIAGEGEGEGECDDGGVGEWLPMAVEGAPPCGDGSDVVWTGSELIVIGGTWDSNIMSGDRVGAAYDPESDTWRPLAVGEALSPALEFGWGDPAFWTGSEMIIWRPDADSDPQQCAGAAYSPAEDRWRSIDAAVALCGIAGWTGAELLVWNTLDGLGAAWDPTANSWRPMASEGGPMVATSMNGFRGGWMGEGLLVWSPQAAGFYDPETDSWRPVSQDGAPEAEWGGPAAALVEGKLILIYEEVDGEGPLMAVSYDSASDTWSSLAPPPLLTGIYPAGDQVLAWSSSASQLGALYDPRTDEWRPLSSCGSPTALHRSRVVWTGAEVLAFGVDYEQNLFKAARLRF